MSKISYPFAAIPNQVIRAGHGLTNLGVLVVLMSHGRSTASLQTLADEAGCKRDTIKKALKYWQENGADAGINIKVTERNRKTYIIEIEVTRCDETIPQKGVSNKKKNIPPKGGKHTPKRGVHLPPKRGTEEEPLKKNQEEDKKPPLPPKGDNESKALEIIDATYMLKDGRRNIQIIGLYAKAKRCVFDNKEQAQSFIRRNVRATLNLEGYGFERIAEVMHWLGENAEFKWTLETVAKYIDDDLTKITKKTPQFVNLDAL